MAQSATASSSLPVAQMNSRQARLDAAIALFRSEASASGYVVEEVRLTLPSPDVDVMPRVIIAQQSGYATTPPTFPKSKHPRPLFSYRSGSSSKHAAPQICEQQYSNSTNRKSCGVPIAARAKPDFKSGNALGKGLGLKRTVSGSVIFHPVPARAVSSKRKVSNPTSHASPEVQKMGPLSSIPYLPRKESSSSGFGNGAINGSRNTAFWKTVIGSEKGEAILRAAESMHRMRHGANGPQFRLCVLEEEGAKMEGCTSVKKDAEVNRNAEMESETKATKERRKMEEEAEENTLHIKGQNIPESHVQLLLSSAADISAREKTFGSKKISDLPIDKSLTDDDKNASTKLEVMVNGRPSGTKAIQASNGKQRSLRGRKDSSDRHHSRSSAARPFKCHKCPSSFDRDGHLRVHILAVHEKKRPFVCQVCDATFGHSSSLLRHVRTVHQASPALGSGKIHRSSRSAQKSNDFGTKKLEDSCDRVEDDDEKHFRCSVCGQTFHRVALLNRHVANSHPLRSLSPEESSSDTRKSP